MSINPKDFDMPVASFNPNPMKLGLFTDGLPDMPFEQEADVKRRKMGIQVLKIATARLAPARPIWTWKEGCTAPKHARSFCTLSSRGLELYALNCSANAIAPASVGQPRAGRHEHLPSGRAAGRQHTWSRRSPARRAGSPNDLRPSKSPPTPSRPK